MARSIYITALEPQCGKSVVALGLMELLSTRAEKVAFFRPIVPSGEERDPQIELVRRRYELSSSYEEMHVLSDAEAQEAVASGNAEDVEKRVVSAFKELERDSDALVVEGTDFTGRAPALDFDLNARLANTLGCPVLAVVRAASPDDAVAAVRVARESLQEKGCDVFGVIVSRVPLEQVSAVSQAVAAGDGEHPVYVLAEAPELGFPTVGEVASALGGRLVGGSEEGLGREVRDVRIAAMSVEHFLEELSKGTLVIVPGDRADILMASLVSATSSEVPAVAGLVITGGYERAPAIQGLLDAAPFPVIESEQRTYDVAAAVREVQPALTVEGERKVAAALGLFQSSVDALEIQHRIELERPARMTPVMFEYELIERATELKQHIVLPEGDDDRVLRAADILLRREVVNLTILGDPADMESRAATLGLDLSAARLVDPQESPLRQGFAERYYELRKHKGMTEDLAFETVGDVTYFGTLMVQAGEADGMVSGAAHTTGDTIRPAFEVIKARPGAGVVSSVFLMLLPDRVLVYGDCAVNPNPDVEQLADIAISSAETAYSFGVEPRIAMLSYSTGESAKGEDVDKVRAATDAVRERRLDLKVEGPIQYDAAIEPSVAEAKMPESEVAGQATVFIFPDLETGNIAYKAVQRSSGASAVGPVLQGLRKPVNDLSRGCKVPDIVSTVVITAIQAQEATGRSTSRLQVQLPSAG